jgi:hypothetical protein
VNDQGGSLVMRKCRSALEMTRAQPKFIQTLLDRLVALRDVCLGLIINIRLFIFGRGCSYQIFVPFGGLIVVVRDFYAHFFWQVVGASVFRPCLAVRSSVIYCNIVVFVVERSHQPHKSHFFIVSLL